MKKNKLPSLIVLMILTTITTVFWVFFSIYRVFTEKPDAIVPEEMTIQIDPKFDTKTLDLMKTKIYP